MTSGEIRQKFLDFYKARGHAVIPSASLIPENDSTLLFINSGMSPLVPYLLGERHPAGNRLVDSQKSFRTEDIEEVGDSRHDTMFEMLGNWSLQGDYFKKEQLLWWFEFMIDILHLDPKCIYQTVYVGDQSIGVLKDEESIAILKDIFKKYGVTAEEGPENIGNGSEEPGVEIDFSKQRIFAYRDKNWWKRGDAVGELGGPDSETFYDTGNPHNHKFGKYCHLNCDCGRFIEIGNSVFMQYKKTEAGWEELPNKNVDFGGGLERILMAENGESNIFKTDIFIPIINNIEEFSGKKYDSDRRSFEIIADHVKAASFIMSEPQGVVPSNVGAGYIVRRLIRRAVRYGRHIGITRESWLKEILPSVIEIYKDVYPELSAREGHISAELDKEELKFAKTLEKGTKEFERMVSSGNISGIDAFDLYQSYGFPIEMTVELASEHGISVNTKAFDEALKNHQDLSRTASAGMFKGGLADSSEYTTRLHTATHLLLSALRKVLGGDVYQKGANITAERLRFDFSHPAKMTADEILKVEELVNGWISKSLPVSFKEVSIEEARKENAMGVFGAKYGEKVKVYSIGDDGSASLEICGGPHVNNTFELGKFKIIKEEAASAGIRRIKAVLE